ncbi:MAG: hypothetical protein U1G07_17585 [Verrucomicrobiota bacterium]
MPGRAAVTAPVYYSFLPPGQTAVQLWKINPDGTGDQRVPINLIEPGFPSWSKDGRVLALTSVNPQRPNKLSRDVFVFDTVTGGLQIAAGFQDETTTEPVVVGGVIVGEQSKFSFVLPWSKALSPDNARIVVSGFVRSGFTQSPPPQEGMSGVSTVPVTRVYRVADGFPQELLFIGRVRTGFTLGGFGVDWHPTRNIVALAVDVDTPLDERPDIPAESSAIFLMDVVADPVGQNRVRKLTFPHASLRSDFVLTTLAHQTDYGPAFSPNGNQVAYLRALVIMDTNSQGVTQARPVVVSLRIVNLDGTGDRSVLDLNPGFFVNQLSWSPAGDQLAFDIGRQPAPQPLQGPPLLAQPETLELYLINANGTGLTRLHGPGAGNPAWSPRSAALTTPVAIITEPQDQTVEAGSKVQFTVNATGGRGPLQFQWRRNGVDLPGANGPTLELLGVPITAGADFSVVVSDGVESVISRAAKLTVLTSGGGGPAALQARLADGQLRLSWPANSGDLRLQTAPSLGGTVFWIDIGQDQIKTEGDSKTAIVPTSEARRYFRLTSN